MASTYTEKRKQEQASAAPGYRGTSAATQQQLTTLQQGYKPSQNVQNAQQQLTQVQTVKPTAYTSPYAQQLEGIYQQIVNRKPFNYDLNGDMLYQQAKDQYVQGGRQAMMDTTGQASALTGGYGNSWAATAGNQAYQQYLLQLNAIVPDLYDRAAARYDQAGADLYNQYGMLLDKDNTAYGRYQDALAQWNTDYSNAQNAYLNAYNQDYGAYQDALSFWQQQAAAENADYWAGRNEEYADYWANRNEENSNYWATRNQAYNTAMQMLANGQMPSADLLAAAGISQVDAQSMMPAQKTSGGGSSGKSSTKTSTQTASKPLAEYYNDGGTTPLSAGYGPVRSQAEIEAAYAQSQQAKQNQMLTQLTPVSYEEMLKKMLKGG